eukprot:gene2620-biopygen10393
MGSPGVPHGEWRGVVGGAGAAPLRAGLARILLSRRLPIQPRGLKRRREPPRARRRAASRGELGAAPCARAAEVVPGEEPRPAPRRGDGGGAEVREADLAPGGDGARCRL